MKKIFTIIVTIILCFAFTACGNQASQDNPSENETTAVETTSEASQTETTVEADPVEPADDANLLFINDEPYYVSIADLDPRGYAAYVIDATSTYSITAENSGDFQWSVYVLDGPYEDATRYIAEEYTPALEGDGTLDLVKGQYVYVYFSANEFTVGDEDIPQDACLAFNYAE